LKIVSVSGNSDHNGTAGRLGGLLAAGLLLLWLAAGCTVGPDYHPPNPSVPHRWDAASQEGLGAGPAKIANWWTVFHDPELQRLITRAVSANWDLAAAEARVREARAQWRAAGVPAWPELTAGGSYQRVRQSAKTPSSSSGQVRNLFQAGFDALWEVDLFGGVRRSVQEARAQVQASEESRRDVLVSLVAEVATNYLVLRGTQRRLAIARDSIRLQKDTVALTRGRFQAGLGSRLEEVQAEALLAGTEAKVPTLETAVRQAIHRLGVLTGRDPGALLKELLAPAAIPLPPAVVPVGIPSDLLRRRPDVRRAERLLAAATAGIGVAVADLFPRFSITGSLGLQGGAISDFSTLQSRFWSFGPSVSWPVFDAGAARAAVQVRTARQEEALAVYQGTVLTSLEEAENAMVAYGKAREGSRALSRAVKTTRESADIALELYRKGLVDFLNVLQSQLALYQVRDQYVQSRQEVGTSLVALYKALGGGWRETGRQDQSTGEVPRGGKGNKEYGRGRGVEVESGR